MAALVICISVLAGRARNLPLIITTKTTKTGRYKQARAVAIWHKQAFYLYRGREKETRKIKENALVAQYDMKP